MMASKKYFLLLITVSVASELLIFCLFCSYSLMWEIVLFSKVLIVSFLGVEDWKSYLKEWVNSGFHWRVIWMDYFTSEPPIFVFKIFFSYCLIIFSLLLWESKTGGQFSGNWREKRAGNRAPASCCALDVFSVCYQYDISRLDISQSRNFPVTSLQFSTGERRKQLLRSVESVKLYGHWNACCCCCSVAQSCPTLCDP